MAQVGLALTLGLRVQQAFVRLLAGLPPGWQVRLSGKPPVVVDGDTLAPEVQLTLALLERRGEPSPETLSPTEARRVRRRLSVRCTPAKRSLSGWWKTWRLTPVFRCAGGITPRLSRAVPSRCSCTTTLPASGSRRRAPGPELHTHPWRWA
jgi:hypothetical protein